MINIKNKSDCCGCSACVQRCPKQCITMDEDNEGFLYPKINKSVCIDCGLCEKVCPVINKSDKASPISFNVAINKDENIRLHSSSGGVFSLIAEYIIKKGGVVFGARFDDNYEVVHSFAETEDELSSFRGSKYVQSNIGNSFVDVENFLKKGRYVLFSGTPCQVVGLKRFLRREYENLLTIDFICHGVPSPSVFRNYIQEEIKQHFVRRGIYDSVSYPTSMPKQIVLPDGVAIKDIRFRDKREGWKNYSFIINMNESENDGNSKEVYISSNKNKNLYLKGFLSNVFLRPSCFKCPSLASHSSADITLADLWGADKVVSDMFDDKGTSLVVVNTRNAEHLFENLSGIEVRIIDKTIAIGQNPAYFKQNKIPGNKQNFWKAFHAKGSLYALRKYACQTNKEWMRSKIIQLTGKIGILSIIRKTVKK